MSKPTKDQLIQRVAFLEKQNEDFEAALDEKDAEIEEIREEFETYKDRTKNFIDSLDECPFCKLKPPIHSMECPA